MTAGRTFDVALAAKRRRGDGAPGWAIWIERAPSQLPERPMLFERFVADEELWRELLAIAAVFERHARTMGEDAPLVRVVDRFGLEGFRALVREERTKLGLDPTFGVDRTSNVDRTIDVERGRGVEHAEVQR